MANDYFVTDETRQWLKREFAKLNAQMTALEEGLEIMQNSPLFKWRKQPKGMDLL